MVNNSVDSDSGMMRRRMGEAACSRDRLLLAVSGGADSMGMLGMLTHELKIPAERLVVCHVDHGLRRESVSDASVVREFSDALGVDCRVRSVDVMSHARAERLSIEAAARELRYGVLREEAEAAGCALILTGHTMDDSAETVLMRMRSGAPWYEWTGIPARRGMILRPMIDLYRCKVREYVIRRGIKWVEDGTNVEEKFLRNRLRRRLQTSDFWTGAKIRDLAAAGEQLQVALDGVKRLSAKLTNCGSKQGFTECRGLAIKQILSYFIRLGFLTVERAWAELTGDPERRLPSAVRRQIQDCIEGQSDRASIELPHGFVAEKRGEMLWVYSNRRHIVDLEVKAGACELPEVNRILEIAISGDSTRTSNGAVCLDGSLLERRLVLRNWQAGDRIRMRGRPTKRISDLLNELRLTPGERARTLVLADDRGPLMIPGRAVDRRALPDEHSTSFLKVSWTPLHDH